MNIDLHVCECVCVCVHAALHFKVYFFYKQLMGCYSDERTEVRCAEHTESCDGLLVGIFKHLSHKEIIVLHSHWELLHIYNIVARHVHTYTQCDMCLHVEYTYINCRERKMCVVITVDGPL